MLEQEIRALQLAQKLIGDGRLEREEYETLIRCHTKETDELLSARAREIREQIYGKKVYIRGLIEFSNICDNDCYYCGIRKSNEKVCRYHMSKKEILSCVDMGYELGFRTFVLQGGERKANSDAWICDTVREIKAHHPDCAVTLSVGERSFESYEAFYRAGAERFLLRHETADEAHYRKLHPEDMSLQNRMRCLWDLKRIGYQTGSGFMVGSPWQTPATLAEDLLFLEELQPEMVGIGPFIHHADTPFGTFPDGTLEDTLFFISVLRILLPKALLPATTALGTIQPNGRELGILAGANVVMPNLSPASARGNYMLYQNKLNTGAEGAEGLDTLKKRMAQLGYEITVSRGDAPNFERRG